jgi:hypothetical protein
MIITEYRKFNFERSYDLVAVNMKPKNVSKCIKGYWYQSVLNFIFLMAMSIIALVNPARALDNGVAKTPPMGWNSYNSYNYNITEAQVKANADYMAANLKSLGWQYIVVDYSWYYPGSGTGSPNQDSNFKPALRMDGYGRLLPDITRFPSAAGASGFKHLADYIHGKGLKFGVHLMRGIPRQAVAQKIPILGTNYRANQVNNFTTASWLNQMWGLNMSHPGSQAYLNSVFQLLASWGVDYVKVDDIGEPIYYLAEIEGYKIAIKNSGRPMVLSLSPGPILTKNASHVSANSNMWRVVSDLWDNWPSLDRLFGVLANWAPHRAEGSWPDPDMIPIGRLSVMGPVGSPRYSSLNTDEKRTLMTLWAINRAPLMWGGYMPDNTPADLALMNNAAVIAVNQNSTNNRQLLSGTAQVWVADIPGSNDKYVALFNRDNTIANVSLSLSFFGATSATVTDLWSGSSLGTFNTTFSSSLPAHGAGLFRLILSGNIPTVKPAVYYSLRARHSDNLADVHGESLSDGASVVQWGPNGGTNQKWWSREIGNGYHNIINQNSGKCLNVPDSSSQEGAKVTQWTCNEDDNQQWKFVGIGEGYYQLKARHSNKCLNVANSVKAFGGELEQRNCISSTKSMQWKRQ